MNLCPPCIYIHKICAINFDTHGPLYEFPDRTQICIDLYTLKPCYNCTDTCVFNVSCRASVVYTPSDGLFLFRAGSHISSRGSSSVHTGLGLYRLYPRKACCVNRTMSNLHIYTIYSGCGCLNIVLISPIKKTDFDRNYWELFHGNKRSDSTRKVLNYI